MRLSLRGKWIEAWSASFNGQEQQKIFLRSSSASSSWLLAASGCGAAAAGAGWASLSGLDELDDGCRDRDRREFSSSSEIGSKTLVDWIRSDWWRNQQFWISSTEAESREYNPADPINKISA